MPRNSDIGASGHDWVPAAYRADRPVQKIAPLIGGIPVIGEGESPLEHVTANVIFRYALLCTDAIFLPQYADIGELHRSTRAFLDRPHLHLPYELTYTRLRLAGCFDSVIGERIDDLERHVWRWMSFMPELPAQGIPAFVQEQLTLHFSGMWHRIDSDLDSMAALVSAKRPSDAILMELAGYDTRLREFDHHALQCGLEDEAVQRRARERFPSLFQTNEEPTNTAEVRRSIKRATKLSQRLGYNEPLRRFVAGQEITFFHPDSNLEFRACAEQSPHKRLFHKTQHVRPTVPFRLAVHFKDGPRIAKLCVYATQTPVLDFLLAMGLHIEAGDELKILRTANWFGLTKEDAVWQRLLTIHPEFENRKQTPRQRLLADPNFEEWMLHEPRPFVLEDYLPLLDKEPVVPGVATHPPLPEDTREVTFYYDPARFDRHQQEVQESVGRWLAKPLATWARICDPLDEMLAVSGITRRNPSWGPVR